MADVKKLYDERLERMQKALKGEKADKIPVLALGHVPFAKFADKSVVTADAVERPEYFLDKAMEGIELLADIDMSQGFSGAFSKTKGMTWISRVKLPGVELGRDEMFQIVEEPHMEYEDYYTILNKGWDYFVKEYVDKFLGLVPEDYKAGKDFADYANKLLSAHGYPVLTGAATPNVWDNLTSMRGMNVFFRDLRKDPQLIKNVQQAIDEATFGKLLSSLDKLNGWAVMVQPGVRANCDFISRKTYEEFIWPYTTRYANAVIEAGIPVYFHYDANWTMFLDFFTCFPAHTCIFDSDGTTDIYKVKELLGGRMAITGNVSASMLALGNPDEVYNFVKKQIADIGPEGYIVCSSCTVPSNCKPENLKAMVCACR